MATGPDLQVRVIGYPDSDDRERAALAADLEQVVRAADVDDVSRPRAGSVPEGAKGSALEWAQLIVSGVGSLPALLAAIQAWLNRKSGAAVSIAIDGDTLTLSDASDEERSALVRAWMSRHAE